MQNTNQKLLKKIGALSLFTATCMLMPKAQAQPSVGYICANENDPTCLGGVSALLATGEFSSVTGIDSSFSTPTLGQLSGFNALLVSTNGTPNDPAGLGNVLDQYYALGNVHLTIATYAFSSPWAIAGAVTSGNDAGLTNSGAKGDVSGKLVATVPGDPIFNGIDLSLVSYFENGNFALPGLANGATLLATDGNGVDMIARSSNGIIDVNLFPDFADNGNNAAFYNLIANTLGGSVTTATPEPGTLGLLALGFIGSAVWLRRRNRQFAA